MVQCFKGGNIVYQVNAGFSRWAKGEQFQCSSSTDLSINISIFFCLLLNNQLEQFLIKVPRGLINDKKYGKIWLVCKKFLQFLQSHFYKYIYVCSYPALANLNQTCECQNNFAFINYLCKGQVVSPCTIQAIIQLQIAMIYFPIILPTAYIICTIF